MVVVSHRAFSRYSKNLLYFVLFHLVWWPFLMAMKSVDLLWGMCKGTSVCFLTSPILSHSPPVHMYSPSSPLYYLQGPYLKPMTSRPDGPMTFQKSTHQQLSTSHVPTRSYLNSIRRTKDALVSGDTSSISANDWPRPP
jgi:hypothetical protein